MTIVVGTNYADSIDNLLVPSPSGSYLQAMSTFDPSGTSAYNTNLFGGGGALLDFTGVCWNTANLSFVGAAKCVAISKRHLISTDHTAFDWLVDDFKFVKADGTLYSAPPIDQYNLIGSNDTTSAFRIVYLNADLPSGINIYPLFVDRSDLVGKPVIHINRLGNVLVKDVQVLSSYMSLTQPENTTRQVYYQYVESGDSGTPVFTLAGLQLAYLGSVTTGPFSGGNGPCTLPLIADILNAIKVLNARNGQDFGYMPKVFSLNRKAAIGNTRRMMAQ